MPIVLAMKQDGKVSDAPSRKTTKAVQCKVNCKNLGSELFFLSVNPLLLVWPLLTPITHGIWHHIYYTL